MYTPVTPSYTVKVGFKGCTFHGHVFMSILFPLVLNINVYILKRKSFATVLHPFFLQYGPCEDILMIITYVPAQ